MQGLEKSLCNTCISALIAASQALMETSIAEILAMVNYGKGDTYAMDAIPEIIIKERIRQYNNLAIFVTEETNKVIKDNWPSSPSLLFVPPTFFSDPIDRSKFLKIFFEIISKDNQISKIGDLWSKQDWPKIWDTTFEAPASITGATMSITCLQRGKVIFSVILNYVTQVIYIATPIGIFQFRLPNYKDLKKNKLIDLDYIVSHAKELTFPTATDICHTADDFWRFTTFIGKKGYQENFDASMIFMDKPGKFLHHAEPGGPSRILYLSELQKNFPPIGFIMYNGEKISEWIHCLPFIKFAKNKGQGDSTLKIFEVSIESPTSKDGVYMSVLPSYSIFYEENDKKFIDISGLRRLPSPNKFRSMLVVTQHDNERIIYTMQKHQYRDVTDYF